MISARLLRKRSILIIAAFFLSACTYKTERQPLQLAPQLTEQGKIIELATGKVLTPQQLINKLSPQQRVIVGEKHDNRYHHQIEQWVAQMLQQSRPQGSVLLEMLTPSQQVKVDSIKKELQGNVYVRDEKLQSALKWNAGWPWDQYGELIRYLMESPYPVLAANMNKEEITEAYHNPPVLQGERSTQPIVQELINQTIKTSHGGALTDEQAAKMTVIQQLRDRAMAEALLKAPTPALLFAGGYHATRAIGVPLHVQDLASSAEFSVLIISEEGSEIDHLHADYVWYTPKSD